VDRDAGEVRAVPLRRDLRADLDVFLHPSAHVAVSGSRADGSGPF